MHDATFVGGLEGLGDLPGDAEGLVDRQRPAPESIGEVLSLDQFHHQRAVPSGLLEAVHRGNGGMGDRREHLRFAFEPRHALGIVREPPPAAP